MRLLDVKSFTDKNPHPRATNKHSQEVKTNTSPGWDWTASTGDTPSTTLRDGMVRKDARRAHGIPMGLEEPCREDGESSDESRMEESLINLQCLHL